MRTKSPAPLFIPCAPPPEHGIDHVELARVAVEHNPANAPPVHAVAAWGGGMPEPQFIAVMTSKYWGPSPRTFGVSFLDGPNSATRRMILAHMNAWSGRTGMAFAESARGEVRISRGRGGYWSFLGTDILSIPAGSPTMNLEGFTERTPESEYMRVVRHETGHTLGCPHEHMRREIIAEIDPGKAIAYGARAWGWSPLTVTQQVLTPVEESSLMGTATAEQDSIMCYQFPGEITRTGQPIVGGSDITEGDYGFMAKLYPPATPPPPPPPTKPQPGPIAGGDRTPEQVQQILSDYLKATEQMHRQIAGGGSMPGDFTPEQVGQILAAYFEVTEQLHRKAGQLPAKFSAAPGRGKTPGGP